MTPPMTPREKVRQIIDDALNSAIPEPWEVANHATDRIFTALASGSGDHAELAEQARRDIEWTCLTTVRPSVLLDILAENAALRARENELIAGHAVAVTALARKLAEAVGLLEQFAAEADRQDGVRDYRDGDVQIVDCRIPISAFRRVRTFLSKEAERG